MLAEHKQGAKVRNLALDYDVSTTMIYRLIDEART